MKYLFCNGCSFVHGENAGHLFNYGRDWNAKLRFSKLLADKLGLEEINIAANGESNHYTVRTTYDWIEANKDKVKEKNKLFRQNNTDRIKCDICDCMILKVNFKSHTNTKKHINNIKK